MLNEFTCSNCGAETSDRNALCDLCWSEYLGTHIGGRMDEECDCYCPICINIQKRYKIIKEKKQ
jgi:hypothetical protein